MEKSKIKVPAAAAAVWLILLCICGHASSSSKKTYLLHMKPASALSTLQERTQSYTSSLESMAISESNTLYIYNHFDLCSVSLTAEEAQQMSSHPDVLSLHEEQTYHPLTTRIPFFLDMEGPGAAAQLPGFDNGSQVIIGVLDTGVWPESPSFNDNGMGPVPKKFKGGCDDGIKCNRKLVGARSFSKGYQQSLLQSHRSPKQKKILISPRDTSGHGTHTSSTAGGSAVPNANLFGFARGTARGMLASARIAVYKICWPTGCFSSDVLAAMDQAIQDNVDVMSLSIGGEVANYNHDATAIGAFAAMQKGILVSCSAGNSGPAPASVTNVAPWILTVGAGTLDRDFPVLVELGDGKIHHGVSLYMGHSRSQSPMVYARYASTDGNSSLCLKGTLVPAKVKGKIVLCDRGGSSRVEKGFVVRDAGGAGMVLANTAENGDELMSDAHVLPSTAVTFTTGNLIKRYLASAGKKASASFSFPGTKLGVKPSPVLAAFSSRGPNPLSIGIMKPDIIAPGVNILAAWTGDEGPTGLPFDKRRVDFNIISGTSMSCPIVSGLAAMLKVAHPGWSPAAIRSALMTTAYNSDTSGKPIIDSATGKPATPLQVGAGHVRPMAALDPGLVYDLSPSDYNNFLCAKNDGAPTVQIQAVKNIRFTCDKKKKYRVSDLNYPSFVVSLEEASQKDGATHTRTLMNVGKPGTYKVSVLSPTSFPVKITVEPQTLTFDEMNQKKSYEVKFQVVTKMHMHADPSLFARIEWSDDDEHVVGSPIAFISFA